MSTQTNASLLTYKNDARRLRKAFRRNETDAQNRIAAHIDAGKDLKHADFLHVIALEAGFASWPKLKFSFETANLNRTQRAERLKRALYSGQHWITDKLLADDPSLKDFDLAIQAALGDLEAVRKAILADPLAATAQIGARTPFLHLCFSKDLHRRPSMADSMIAIAKLLIEQGADVNEGFSPEADADHQLSALYGAMCHADNFPLGQWLLENGADPNDNESLYHATELGSTKALESLLNHGAKPDGTNALPRALDFDNLDMVRLLLEAGASPNLTVPDHPSGQPMNSIPALHQAVRRGRGAETVKLLMEFGADAEAEWQGHTAYAMAMIHANTKAAEALRTLGFATELNFNEEILAVCARGDMPSRKLDLSGLNAEDRTILTRIAGQTGCLAQVRAFVAAGLDPNEPDQMGLPPLQVAGWNGVVDALEYFLQFAPDLTHKNAYGGNALDTVLHGCEFSPKQEGADHIECARLLLEAGSVIFPDFLTGCGDEDMVAFLEDWVDRYPEVLKER